MWSMKLEFKSVELGNKELIDSYSFKYGDDSCQHSFVSMYGHFGKYGDSYCEKDGWLYLNRSGLNTEEKKICLCPMGDFSDEEGYRRAIENLLEDVASEGKRLVFETATKAAKERIEELFPGVFRFEYSRDWAEYVYTRNKLVNLPGSHMSKRRYQYKSFYRKYEGRVRIEAMSQKDIENVLAFQRRWMSQRMAEGDNPQLLEENEAIIRELGAFERLSLQGIVIYVDEAIAGYAFGAPLSEECFDVLVEKGDRNIDNIYRVLKRELPAALEKYARFNWEEDVGDAGLRQIKLDYYPDILMDKYRAEEIG